MSALLVVVRFVKMIRSFLSLRSHNYEGFRMLQIVRGRVFVPFPLGTLWILKNNCETLIYSYHLLEVEAIKKI